MDYFSSDDLGKDLKQKTARGGAYLVATQMTTVLVGLAAIPILTRLLDKSDFGLVAMVTVFTGIAALFVDSGMSMATIQQREITHAQVSNLFWFSACLGLAIALLICTFSPAIAWFYGEPRLILITMAISTSSIFSGLTLQHQALLRRTMQFRRIATVQVASFVAGYAIAVVLAWYYRSYWALVALPVSTAAIRMVATWWASDWRPGLPRRGTGVRPMVGFGANVTGFTFVNYFSRSGDYMLIGWWWGEVPLGIYERAYKLMMAPMRQINGPLSQLFIPALSRLVDQPQSYRRAYTRVLESILVLTVPLAAFAFVASDLCIRIFLGREWGDAVPIFSWLALAAVVHPASNTTSWLFISQGRSTELFHWGIVGAALCITSFLVGLPWGPTYVAAAYSLSGLLIRVPLVLWWATRKGPVRLVDVGTCLPLPLALGGSVFLVVTVLRQLLGETGTLAEFSACLAAAILVGLVIMLATRQGQRWLSFCRELFAGQGFQQKRA